MEQHRDTLYVRQSERLGRILSRLQQRSKRLSFIRLAIIAAGIPAVYVATLAGAGAAWGVVAGVVAAFFAVAVVHDRVEQGRRRHELWRQLTDRQAAQIRRDWSALPLPYDTTVDAAHPFAADLAVTGRRSLHHLIDTTTSEGGSNRLREWLLFPLGDPQSIAHRQQVVRELLPLSLFRKKLALYGTLIARGRWNAGPLFEWIDEATPRTPLLYYILPLVLLAVVNIASFILSMTTGAAPLWLTTLPLYLAVYGVVYAAFFRYLHGFANGAVSLKYAVERIQPVLLYIERHPATRRGALAPLLDLFYRDESRPSAMMRSLTGLTRAAGMQNNIFAWMALNALLPWNLFFYDRLNRYRHRLRDVLPRWLDSVYELEAYSALAGHAHLNPDSVFPVVHTRSGGPVLAGRALGHPLLPGDRRICNDFALDGPGAVALVTGSNMSGKSTFLRTVGINTVLALAGATVTAEALALRPLRVFSSMAVSDSVVDGISFFYAEVKRLAALLREARHPHDLPLLFLIDEIFRGTNNRERLIGSRAYIRALAETDAFGLVSTHDLELVHLAQENSRIVNYHFREEVHDGVMVFGYRLHYGPCPTTNALAIMALEGLPVDLPVDLPRNVQTTATD